MASSSKKVHALAKECGPRCRSKLHAQQLINAVTKGNLRQIQLFCCTCYNPGHVSDRFSRSVLHAAASCGRWQLVQWLLEERGADAGTKDLENGWTALHRALFYGQLSVARLLISNGASLQVRDREGLTPLDVAMKDRLPHVEFVQSGLQEVYTWGDNSNFTLGHDSMQRKKYPEMVDVLRKAGVSIRQVVMCKYHSVFVSTAGQVYTCGHGLGGRLGHGNEKPCLVPTLVESVRHEECVRVDGSRDHTVMLMESGVMFSCGLNDCHQLGHFPVPARSLLPRQITGKALKGRTVKGVCAQRFHTVVYTADAVFTFGLNAGQLGHLKVAGEKVVTQARQVSALNHKDVKVKLVAASDAATVVVTVKGDVYALHEYQCRKITSKRLDIVQVAVSGGHLDHNLEMEGLYERGGSELAIALLNLAGRVHIWRESDPQLKRCSLLIRRPLSISQITLSVHGIAFVTQDGEAFVAPIPKIRESRDIPISPAAVGAKEHVASSPPVDSFSVRLTDLVDQEEVADLRVERLPMVHRATAIATDRKGHNFAVLQSQPNACLTEIPCVQETEMGAKFQTLLDEANTTDLIHDVLLQVGSLQVAAHKFILASRSEFFQKLFCQKTEDWVDSPPVVSIENADVEIFQQLIKFLYTDTCDLLKLGGTFKMRESFEIPGIELNLEEVLEEFAPPKGKKVSAFQVYQEGKKKKGKKKGGEGKGNKEEAVAPSGGNPVKMLQDLAKRYGVKSLVKRLEAVKWVNGNLQPVQARPLLQPRLKFERSNFQTLYDVGIKSQDGVTVWCHKCVLVARLEYFHSMLASGWIETSNTEALTLPVPGDILSVVLDYLYTDEAWALVQCEDPEFLCNVLVVADQLLIGRLRDICEVAIASLITLKNACELLELASLYNATQLRTTCQQFITINLPALLESRSLDVLSDDVIDELAAYYKDVVPGMSRRRITPYDGWPDGAYLESLEAAYADVDIATVAGDLLEEVAGGGRKAGSKAKRRRTRTKSTDDDQADKKTGEPGLAGQRAERQISESSDTSLVMDLEEVTIATEEGSPVQSPREKIITPSKKPDSRTKPRPSQPLVIPTRSNPWGPKSPNSSSQEPPHSPTSPLGAEPSQVGGAQGGMGQGLRTIMEQESSMAAMRLGLAQQKSGGAGKKSHKISQKERKKLQSQNASEDVAVVTPQTTPQADAAKSKAWGTVANPWGAVGNVVQSFKDLMLDEKEQHPPVAMATSPVAMATSPGKRPARGAGGAGDKSYSWGLPSMAPVTPQSPSSPRGEGNNPWQRLPPPVSSPRPRGAAAAALALTEIIQDEMKQRATLQRATNKRLTLIQIEEQAIQELLQHYKADDIVDEVITVERVPTTLAKPTWAATQRQ